MVFPGVWFVVEAERWGPSRWSDLYECGGLLPIRDDDAFGEVSLEGGVADDRGDEVEGDTERSFAGATCQACEGSGPVEYGGRGRRSDERCEGGGGKTFISNNVADGSSQCVVGS